MFGVPVPVPGRALFTRTRDDVGVSIDLGVLVSLAVVGSKAYWVV